MVKPIDPGDDGVWSVPCFVVPRAHRRTGVATALLAAAVEHAAAAGARVVEAYPVATGSPGGAAGLYPGGEEMFRRAGFTEVRRPTPRRLVVRREVTPGGRSP
jgi:GNAT superfamily N-acetyltransferase